MADEAPKKENLNDPKKLGSFVERMRSYESDLARLKGVPLAPVVELKVTPPPPQFQQVKTPINPYKIAGKPEVEIENKGNVAETFVAANTIVSDVVIEDPQKAKDALHIEQPLQKMRTIQTDVQDTAKEHKTTVEDVIQAAQREISKKVVIDSPKSSALALSLSAMLIVASIVAIGVWYNLKTQPKTVTPIVIDTSTIIKTENTSKIVWNKLDPLRLVIAEAQKTPSEKEAEITRIEITSGTSSEQISVETFASALSGTIPTWLVRAFNEDYFVGMYENSSRGLQPVFIFKLNSYENGYAGMLKWEETIPSEFALFTNSSSIPTQTTVITFPTVANSTSSIASTNNPVIRTGFKDAIIKNKDTRVLEDAGGRRVLLYSFADQDTLVITTDQSALEETSARLTTSKFVR